MKKRILKRKKDKRVKLGKPQLRGLIVKLFTMTPKKPNSALRKVAKVKLIAKGGILKNKTVIAYIPGEKNALTMHTIVLIIPKRKKDLPGVKYTILNPPRSK